MPSAMLKTLMVLAASSAVLVASPAAARTTTEWVYVAEVDGYDATLVRFDGSVYRVRRAVGCIGLRRKEGEYVLAQSPGLSFLGLGSKLILPDRGQECLLHSADRIGVWGGL